jgi:hypothetical protein
MIKVYFESNSHAELVATFETEEIYSICLPKLEEKARQSGLKITESVEEETLKLPIYWSIEDFENTADRLFCELQKNNPKEFENFANWEQFYDKTKFPYQLERMISNHDANEGITWETLEYYVGQCEIKN